MPPTASAPRLKIGQKIPVATGSYNAGVSTGVASIGVQTQFTYIDVGVNIDMTPTVHYDREVTLKLEDRSPLAGQPASPSAASPSPSSVSDPSEQIIHA